MTPDAVLGILGVHALGVSLGALVTWWGMSLRLEGAEAEVRALRRLLDDPRRLDGGAR